MKFSEIYGNEDIKKALVRIVDSDRIPHAILFHENEGGIALALIQAFLQYLNCKNKENGEPCGVCPTCQQISKYIHPDIHYTFPITSGSKVSGKVSDLTSDDYIKYFRELAIANPFFMENELTAALGIEKKSGLISAAEAKSILKRLSIATVTDGYRVIVIWLPEKMNASAANSLLKEIEEPNEKTIFLLISHSPEEVMQTILSRCLRIRVQPSSKEEIVKTLVGTFKADLEEASRVAEFAGGSVGEALFMLSDEALSSQMHNLFADLMDSIIKRDLEGTLLIGEDLASLESREKQKAFCNFVGECLRKIFMYQQDLENLSGVSPEEEEFYKQISQKCSKSFSRKSMMFLDRASMLLDRNVNQKILFCALVTRMFFSI